jgi:Tol biopolymer transport system component
VSTNVDLDRKVAALLADTAAPREPAGLLNAVLFTTRRTRPRPRWLALIKEPPMRTNSRLAVGSPTFRLASIMALTVALILAAAAAVVIGASPKPSLAPPLPPFGPAANGSLIYEKAGDIWVADSDGSNAKPIITGPTLDHYPGYSHDGTKISWGRGPDSDLGLWVANTDGSDAHQVMAAAQWGDFTPSDTQLAMTRTLNGHLVISVVDVDGSNLHNLDIGTIEPRGWLMPRPPDGQELIFTGRPNPGKKDLGIFAVNLDGTGLRTIGAISTTESGDSDRPGQSYPIERISFQDPTLSPDGKLLTYWSWEPVNGPGTPSDGYVHVRDLTTGEDHRVSIMTDNASGVLPRFSPDGKSILARSNSGGGTQLAIGAADGSAPGVPFGPTYDYNASQDQQWSPDGTRVYLTIAGVTSIIEVASGETTALKDVPSMPGWQRLAPTQP